MTRRRMAALAGRGATILLVCAAAAFAGERGEPQHAEGIPVVTLLLSTINLAIFIWILARFVMPQVRHWVANRRTRVVTALEAAAKAKAEAERLRREWEARLAEIEPTIETLRAQARADAERERTRILDAARHTAETIRRDAERAAAYEIRRTQEQLRVEMVRQALQMAEAGTRTEWSAADQERSVGEFLKQVGK